MLDPEDVRRFVEATTRVQRLQDAMVANGDSQIQQANITVNAGGVGVWIAVTAVIASVTMNLCLLAMLVIHDREIDDLRHVLNAIYMMAPSLKPEAN